MNSFNSREKKILKSLNTPQKIQNYLDSIPFNHELGGETCRSAYRVLSKKEAHCLEGAFLAAAALQYHGRSPLVVSLKVLDVDYDHIITLYKENGYWGAISKTNHAVLSWRDPVYKNIRELVMSYFHEYFLVKNGRKTMRGYSRPINLNRFGSLWMTSSENLFYIAELISDAKHLPVIPKENEKFIRKATTIEQEAAKISWDNK